MTAVADKEFEEWCPYTDVEENYRHREELFAAWTACEAAMLKRIDRDEFRKFVGGYITLEQDEVFNWLHAKILGE